MPSTIITEGGGFEIQPGNEIWTAGNAKVGLTVVGSDENTNPTNKLDGRPALCWINNSMKPFVPGAPQEQVLIAELNGVFCHIKIVDGKVFVVLADNRMS